MENITVRAADAVEEGIIALVKDIDQLDDYDKGYFDGLYQALRVYRLNSSKKEDTLYVTHD